MGLGVFVVSCCCSCFFFFSSRRRHTRLVRDWSSDVCSSDLAVDNQIDFGFSISQRDGLDVNGELIQQFSVGISLGDIWFIKRRAR